MFSDDKVWHFIELANTDLPFVFLMIMLLYVCIRTDEKKLVISLQGLVSAAMTTLTPPEASRVHEFHKPQTQVVASRRGKEKVLFLG